MQPAPNKQTFNTRRLLRVLLVGTALSLTGFAVATMTCLQSPVTSWGMLQQNSAASVLKDRHGVLLSNRDNDRVSASPDTRLYQVPPVLTSAFIASEDQRFYQHHGIDWQARFAALYQNIKSRQQVRGASTISEQVVRMLHQRPRNIWSKWLEGIEAVWLEQSVGKADILEFYLNNIPYAGNRRGITQAARYYFDRDLSTLNTREMLALVVLARAPSAYDLYKHEGRITRLIDQLAARLPETKYEATTQKLHLRRNDNLIEASHYTRFVRQQNNAGNITTTLNSNLQQMVQGLLDTRLQNLKPKNVQNAAALIIDHRSGDILAWVIGGANKAETPGHAIDAVLTPRQPGSAMKPFLYALALQNGQSAATLINDKPLVEAIGAGLHRFRNYSGQHYGFITLREALANSLNIPALLTIRQLGTAPYLNFLHDLGFTTLDRGSDIYDEGLALGIGEVSLYEMVRAYAVLANRGQYQDLRVFLQQDKTDKPRTVLSAENAALISDILSDRWARRLEFGQDSVLNLATQTAVKTGTSNDYHDAWVFGYNDAYVVGIWMGNLDRKPMENVTGSTGPALVMRSIFTELNRQRDSGKLYRSPKLLLQDVCIRPVDAQGDCPKRSEFFTAAQWAEYQTKQTPIENKSLSVELVRPTQNLHIAYDPRIPASAQQFRFELKGLEKAKELQVTWLLNGAAIASTTTPTYQWPVRRGRYELGVAIKADGQDKTLPPVTFFVK